MSLIFAITMGGTNKQSVGERLGRSLALGRWGAAAGGLCLAVFFFGSASARQPPSQMVAARAPSVQLLVAKSGAATGIAVALDTPHEAKALCDRAHQLLKQGTAGSGDNRALMEAIDSYRRCLPLVPRAESPLDWAMTQINLGVALETLGARESGTARLEESLAAFRQALQENTRARVPLRWTQTQENLALVHRALYSKTREPHYLDDSLHAIDSALEEFCKAKAAYDIERAERLRGEILATKQTKKVQR